MLSLATLYEKQHVLLKLTLAKNFYKKTNKCTISQKFTKKRVVMSVYLPVLM